jgi:hypothetical protein
VVVCPYCPDPDEVVWVILVNLQRSPSIISMINHDVVNDRNFLLIPVQCGSCRRMALDRLIETKKSFAGWEHEISYDKLMKTCSRMIERFCSMWSQLVSTPYCEDRQYVPVLQHPTDLNIVGDVLRYSSEFSGSIESNETMFNSFFISNR